MPKRIERVNQLLKEEVSRILLKELDFSREVLVTVTRAEASPNLNQARVYISVMPEGKRNKVFEILGREIYGIQQILNKRLEMRPVPKISFVKESKTEEAGRVEEILEGLKKS